MSTWMESRHGTARHGTALRRIAHRSSVRPSVPVSPQPRPRPPPTQVTFRVFPQKLVRLGLHIMDTKQMVKKISTDILVGDRTAFILVQPELTAPVGLQHLPCLAGQGRPLVFGRPIQTQRAHETVYLQCYLAEHLAQPAGAHAAL